MTSKKVFSVFTTILTVVVIIMAIDFVGFIAWSMSGQMPVDNFFVGSITKHILQAIFF